MKKISYFIAIKKSVKKNMKDRDYEKKTINDMFYHLMVWLEKYIELANFYPNDWQTRKQLDEIILTCENRDRNNIN